MTPRTREPVVVRQEVYYVPKGEGGSLGFKSKFVPVPHAEKPYRVWTLYQTDPEKKPDLPLLPQHNVNAFLEDHVHDWTFHRNKEGTAAIRYYSRVTDGGVWILCEFSAQ